MPEIDALLETIARGRADDPLAPFTVVVPSHVAALQLRRRLAERTAFAAVRFEPLARIAELLGAGDLAASGRAPLARPIADYLAEEVAVESRGALAQVGGLPGYARVLRQLFRRLRRGGISTSADVIDPAAEGHLPEVLRLYDRFRQETAAFYDEDDLFDAAAAAVREGRTGVMPDLGRIYTLPLPAPSASAVGLLEALRQEAPGYAEVAETRVEPAARFVIAPDPASEVREAVREVLSALASGVGLHDIAILHGSSSRYAAMLRDALAAAAIPALIMPGTPLVQTPAGRAVLGLALLPERDYARTSVMDFLAIAPLRDYVPGADGSLRAMTTAWERLSRDAGITHGLARWRSALSAYVSRHDEDLARFEGDDSQMRRVQFERDGGVSLGAVIGQLAARLEPLRAPQPAADFVATFTSIVQEYLKPDAEFVEGVLEEITQLGTIAAVGGSFSLASFARALRANLESAVTARSQKFGEGVFVAGYRLAAGLRFSRVILCGAHEGGFPAGPGADALVEDAAWARLRRKHPYIEDAALRIERSAAAARGAIECASGGELVWCAPLYEPGGTREFYPAPLMVEAASRQDASIATGSALRRAGRRPWLRRGASPLAMQLAGPVVDAGELHLREAIALRKNHRGVAPGHRLWRASEMVVARRSDRFTEWEGNLSALSDDGWLELQKAVSPTSLEKYGACGFRYLCSSLLHLNTVEEPEAREMMDAAERGTLIHDVLETFFEDQHSRGRPQAGEAWTPADLERLLVIADEKLADAANRGLRGLEIFAGFERRTIRADLAAFLTEDTAFRRQTGAVPSAFEAAIPEVTIAGVRLRGYVDRIDRTPDGRCAWVIDYKTGSVRDYEGIVPADPFDGGKKLQLPTYLAAAGDASERHALYWFITQKGGFKQVPYDPSADSQLAFERTLEAIVSGVRAGAFPAVSGDMNDYFSKFENCQYCDFTRICARRRDHAFDEKQGDQAMSPWLAVAKAAALAPEPSP
ncbi:MAG: PD-(D/E)XK nuclease family protein [Chloroflexota bacterium]|nr:PD-(D/E)XK nuclease family protein [Chloroflexota bacterium]